MGPKLEHLMQLSIIKIGVRIHNKIIEAQNVIVKVNKHQKAYSKNSVYIADLHDEKFNMIPKK